MSEWNWLEFLERAIKGLASEEEVLKARELAGNWPTCAVGELCKDLPRRHDGWPVDQILYSMGADFEWYVKTRNWAQAVLVFQGIEKRTTELLAEARQGRFIT